MNRYIEAESLIEAMRGRVFSNDECIRYATDSRSKEYYRHLQFEDGIMMGFVRDQPTANVIPISKGATNGDMIKVVFPNMNIKEGNNVLFDVRGQTIEITGMALKDWWNAPYNSKSEG